MLVNLPFTVLIDSQEQHPFSFFGITADAKDYTAEIRRRVNDGDLDPQDVKLNVATEFKGLGAGQGDYSIAGLEHLISIERKSLEDCQSTVLGWDKRRERFERELDNLQGKLCKAVVVECTLGQLLANAHERGVKTADENRKILFRQILAYQQDFAVPWVFCDSRPFAEIATIRIMQRFYKNFRKQNSN